MLAVGLLVYSTIFGCLVLLLAGTQALFAEPSEADAAAAATTADEEGTQKLILHGQASYTEPSSKFSDLHLDDSSLDKIPPGFNYADLSGLGDFSQLETRWWHVEGGLKQLLKDRYVVEYSLTYDDYNDVQPFLVDTMGSKLGLMLRFNWLF